MTRPDDVVVSIARDLLAAGGMDHAMQALLLARGWSPAQALKGYWTHTDRFPDRIPLTLEGALQRQRHWENQANLRAGAG